MPSQAQQEFKRNHLGDVDKLIDAHGQLGPDGKGRRALGHFTRSGVLMLCAAWEVYIEDLALEMANKITQHASEPTNLRKSTKKLIVSWVEKDKDEIKSLELSGDGWKHCFLNAVQNEIKSLNTPKTPNVDNLYSNVFGWNSASSNWTVGGDYITRFVTKRGEIAHKGSDSEYVKKTELEDYVEKISQTITEHDNAAREYLSQIGIRNPWHKLNT